MLSPFRDIQRIYATALGYFWLPCPCCGEEFGGHEWREVDGLPSTVPVSTDPSEAAMGEAICIVCTAQGYGYPPFFFLADEDLERAELEERGYCPDCGTFKCGAQH